MITEKSEGKIRWEKWSFLTWMSSLMSCLEKTEPVMSFCLAFRREMCLRVPINLNQGEAFLMMIWRTWTQSQRRKKRGSLLVAEAEVGVLRQDVRIVITTEHESEADLQAIIDEAVLDLLVVGDAVPPLIEDAGTGAEVVRLIVAIRGRALVHDRPIVGVTDPNRSPDQSRRKNRRRSRRNPKNLTRRRRKKVRAQG